MHDPLPVKLTYLAPKFIRYVFISFKDSILFKAYFSNEFVKLFSDLKRKEQEKFHSEISDLEYKWYLNI